MFAESIVSETLSNISYMVNGHISFNQLAPCLLNRYALKTKDSMRVGVHLVNLFNCLDRIISERREELNP